LSDPHRISRAEPLDPAIVAALARGETFSQEDGAAAGVQHLQTHMSHVFLTSRRAYKLRKAVRFEFVDFSTRAARDVDCLDEVRLNRRLAPDLYLGIAPLRRRGAAIELGPVSEELANDALEHCVVMRRLPEGRDALTLLERGELGSAQLGALAERIALFHRANPLTRVLSEDEWREHVASPVRESLDLFAGAQLDACAREQLALALERTERFVAEHWDRFAVRLAQGRAVHGHGDLHLQHIWYETPESAPLVVDCVEFRSSFREIDAASEVAFLAMDLMHRGRADLAAHFLRSYAARSDDFGLYSVVDYFIAYRAAVRAKVGELARRDPEVDSAQRERAEQSVRVHLSLSAAALEPRGRGSLVLVCGRIGSGKSSAAAHLAELVDGVVIASDRVRKHLAGLDPLERGHAGLYTEKMTRATYESLAERALPVIDSGRTAILDATYATRALRERTRAWAETHRLEPWLLEVSCDDALVRERLVARRARDDDPSDAGPELLDSSANDYQPPAEWRADRHFRVHTGRPDWPRDLEPLARRIAARA
jgi:uncharacterized protein